MVSRAIICCSCGADTLLKEEPVYDGFVKTGTSQSCMACGHVYAEGDEIPFKGNPAAAIFTDDDRDAPIQIFDEGQPAVCRHCSNYVVNPFVQRCDLHGRDVAATDTCNDFDRVEED